MSESENCGQRLFLVDGTALAYRSHFAFIRNPLFSSKGLNVSAIYGFAATLLRILNTEQPDYCAVVFDTPQPTFRHKLYKEYKATRDKTPDELIEQFPPINEVTKSMGLKVIKTPGWEADDVIGAMAVTGEKQGMEVFLVTGDKDFMQLVSDRVKIYNLTKADSDLLIQGVEEVQEKFGVEPGRVIEVMGLMGDTSDNIPGVPGVGLKTAIKLIDEFKTIDSLYENLDQVKAKGIRTKLEKNKDLALLSRDLVTIDIDAPSEMKLADLKVQDIDIEKFKKLCLEFEFTSLLDRISTKDPVKDDVVRNYTLIDNELSYKSLMEKIGTTKCLVIDLETTSINAHEADIVGISIAMEEGIAFYLPANLKRPIFGSNEKDLARFLEDLKIPLCDRSVEICGQNIKYDLTVFERAGMSGINNVGFDTMVAHYLLYPGELRHNLDYLSLKLLNVSKIPTKDLIGKGKAQLNMFDVEIENVSEYACEDADMTFRLKKILEKMLEDENLTELFKEVEMPLVRVLEEMEREGVKIDRDILKKMSVSLSKRLGELEEEIYTMCGARFNVNSTQQLGKILFDKLELHKELGVRPKKTKTGFSTNATVLESMSSHPLPKALLEYRQLKKLHSTYVEALPRLVNKETGRIHTSFNQAVTATGRLSSSDPNLQNIPIRTELGREIRKAFVSRGDDSVLLAADYSQIELRILAHISGDEALLDAFSKGEDIHRRTASLIFDIPNEDVTKDERYQAKTINFGIIYGMGPHRLARETGINFRKAQEFIDSYFTVFSGVKSFIESTLEMARQNGYVTTLLGRKRPVDEINSTNGQIRSMAENIAVNTPIQGTAADLIKKAMIEISSEMKKKNLKSAMILQVHDELVFDAPTAELETMKELVKDKMENALELRTPVVVDMGVGKNWLDAH